MQPRPTQDASGKPTTQMVSVRSDCVHCFHGQVSCSACSGNGRVTCPSCEGTGNVRTFDQLTVRFRDVTESDLLDPTDLPDELLHKLNGEVIFSKRAERIDASPGVPAHVESTSRTILQKSHTFDQSAARLLLQDLAVERIAVHEVVYTYAGVGADCGSMPTARCMPRMRRGAATGSSTSWAASLEQLSSQFYWHCSFVVS